MQINRNYIWLMTLSIVVLFSGCAQKLPNQSFNPTANKSIHKITLIKVPTPKEIEIFYHNHPGNNFGLIGGLAALAEFKSKTSSYNSAITGVAFDASDYFMKQLQKDFEKTNYMVDILDDIPREKLEYVKSLDISEGDAYLDCFVPSLGYIAGSSSSAYKPTVIVYARVVKNGSNDILYEKQLVSGESTYISEDAEYLNFDTTHTYENFEQLEGNATKSVAGLKIALDTIAAKIVDSLGNKK